MSESLDASVGPLGGLIGGLPADLKVQALTHSSWTDDRAKSYERLAFVGDSVLGLAVAAEVFARFGEVDSGRLTKIHNQAVSGASCAEVGRALGVPQMMVAAERPGPGIPASVLLDGERPLPEVTEALIGACFLAFGFERVASAVAEAFGPRVSLAAETRIDFKSALQELLARRGARVIYEVSAETGPAHDRTFDVVALVDGEQVGAGSGRSKKAAEQTAAERALEHFGG
ncbi:MAG: putative dsRNA-binding protein [Solirubrobacterales bacterium]